MALAAWIKGFFKQFLPPPQRVQLAIANAFKTSSPRPEQRFRLALCWLEKDGAGRDTGTVAEAFTGTEGIELVRSARVVSAPGAADDWRPAMRRGARAVLETWNADLAVVGSVKDPGKALSLWFVPREGDGTLRRGDLPPYELNKATLGPDFHDDFRTELTSAALVAVAPLPETETRGRVLEKGLRDATEKLATLLKKPGAIGPERRAHLQLSLGSALLTLGELESDAEYLKQAIAAYRAALQELPREHVPLDWAGTQNNLGNALGILGELESDAEHLEQAVAAYRAALQELPREHVPRDWARTQNNFGNVLLVLGELESDAEYLKQAVAAYRAALQELTRERVPLDWATTQNNLGNVLQILGKRECDAEYLKQAIAAYRAALQELTRERVPVAWARTQKNLGSALQVLGARESDAEYLKQAIAACRAALQELPREHVPRDWARTQNNLGNALATLGKLESGTEHLEQAVAAYRAALQELPREHVPRDWARTQKNLGLAIQILRERGRAF